MLVIFWYYIRLVFECLRDVILGLLMPMFAMRATQAWYTTLNSRVSNWNVPCWYSVSFFFITITIIAYGATLITQEPVYALYQRLIRDCLAVVGSSVAMISLLLVKRNHKKTAKELGKAVKCCDILILFVSLVFVLFIFFFFILLCCCILPAG